MAAAVTGRHEPAWAAGRTLNVLCHRVHQLCLTTGVAGNLTQEWQTKNDADIAWTTFDTDPLQDRLFREASLDKTDFGVGYLVNSRATQKAASLLEPLAQFQSAEPIEALDDIAPGLRQAMTIGGKLIGIPVRHATNGLFYNEALL
jgi:multiple sugar transport system substrate-binding protein